MVTKCIRCKGVLDGESELEHAYECGCPTRSITDDGLMFQEFLTFLVQVLGPAHYNGIVTSWDQMQQLKQHE